MTSIDAPERDGSVRIESFEVRPERLSGLDAPAKVRLCWSVRGAKQVVLSGHGAVPPVQVRGLVLSVETTTAFVLTAYGSGFSEVASKRACVTVEPALGERRIPIGAIALWSGRPSDVPAGWRLCDGSGGTPDLTDRFVVGAGEGLPAGRRGEGDHGTHALQLVFRGVTGAGGAHRHERPHGWEVVEAGKGDDVVGISFEGHTHLSEAGDHHHDLQATVDHETARGAALKPRWYALCYIKRIGRA